MRKNGFVIGKCENYRIGIPSIKDKKLYEDTNQLVEKISNIMYAVFVKAIPQCMVWSQFLISFVKYFVTDLKDALELPIETW